MNKAELRAEYLGRRRALSPEEVARKSAEAVARLRRQPEMETAAAYLVYLASMDNEVDTLPLVEGLLQAGKTVLVPISRRDRTLAWSRVEGLKDVARTRFGILEPRPECRRDVEPPQGSVAVVPGIVFTREGGRIGYGAGYYDRFLSGFHGPKLALAYELQLAGEMPLEPHDVLMDAVVTEAAVYRR